MHEKQQQRGAATPASQAQMWRLNQLGLVGLRDEPGPPLTNRVVKEILGAAEAARPHHAWTSRS